MKRAKKLWAFVGVMLAIVLLGGVMTVVTPFSAHAITGKNPLVVVLCKFTDQQAEPHGAAYYQDMFSETGAGKTGVYDYWKTVSYGNLDLTGSVVKGWYTADKTVAEFNVLPRNSQLSVCASKALPDVDFSKFTGVVVLTNHTNLQGPLFGNGPPTTIETSLGDITYPNLGRMVAEEDSALNGILHESGHSFGLNHSRTISPTTTDQPDYGDKYDIMSCYDCYGTVPTYQGAGGPGLNAIQLTLAGWLPAGRALAVNNETCTQQTVQMAALNHPEASGPLEARIPAAVAIKKVSTQGVVTVSTTSDYYSVELRSKSGWDGGIPQDTFLVRLKGKDNYSYWVNTAGALTAGKQYVDSAQKTYVAVNSIDPTPSSNGVVTLAGCQINPALSYVGDTTATYDKQATLAADLVVSGTTAPVPFADVKLTLGTQSCTAKTNLSGRASCVVTITQPSGAYTVQADFTGDAAYNPASTSTAFTIERAATTLTYTGPTVIMQGAGGVTLTAVLLEDGRTAPSPSGQTVTLALGDQSCTATTIASGLASCSLTFTGPLGEEPLSATFAGDVYYLPSSDTGKTAVGFAFPSRGAFVLGDTSVATATPDTLVTWWSDSWWLQNAVSGGIAPDSFKGFAANDTTLPTTAPANSCGTTFFTRTGNSPPPTAGVPSYMGVIVASSVTKTGPGVKGVWGKIVVVKTDPGYAPTPGHPGVGKIVATFCP
jgi:hypothetical protein